MILLGLSRLLAPLSRLWVSLIVAVAREPVKKHVASKSEALLKAEARERMQYGPLGETIGEILQHEGTERGYLILSAVYWRIEQKVDARGEDSLTSTERTFLAVRRFDAEINNEGFDQYFFSSTGDDADLALTALRDIAASDAAVLLERAMAVFRRGRPPRDWRKRQMEMQRIDRPHPVWEQADREFYSLELLANRLLAFTKARRAEFVFS